MALALFALLAANAHAAAGGIVAAYSFDEASGTTLGDTTPPTVSITSPANGATVSGTITVSAAASDNTSVTGVQFKLDGSGLASEDTSSPCVMHRERALAARERQWTSPSGEKR